VLIPSNHPGTIASAGSTKSVRSKEVIQPRGSPGLRFKFTPDLDVFNAETKLFKARVLRQFIPSLPGRCHIAGCVKDISSLI